MYASMFAGASAANVKGAYFPKAAANYYTASCPLTRMHVLHIPQCVAYSAVQVGCKINHVALDSASKRTALIPAVSELRLCFWVLLQQLPSKFEQQTAHPDAACDGLPFVCLWEGAGPKAYSTICPRYSCTQH